MQQTIYFQKDIWERLSKEDRKSKLINDLLRTHYNVTQHNTPEPSVTTQDVKKVFPKAESVTYKKTNNWGA